VSTPRPNRLRQRHHLPTLLPLDSSRSRSTFTALRPSPASRKRVESRHLFSRKVKGKRHGWKQTPEVGPATLFQVEQDVVDRTIAQSVRALWDGDLDDQVLFPVFYAKELVCPVTYPPAVGDADVAAVPDTTVRSGVERRYLVVVPCAMCSVDDLEFYAARVCGVRRSVRDYTSQDERRTV
jgi:hypothetical protein